MPKLSDKPLRGKTVLITGAARRLGRATALAMAEAGADVAITFLHSAREAQHTVADLSSLGVRAFALRCDVTDEKSVISTIKGAVRELGGLDVLVNNAANYETIEFYACAGTTYHLAVEDAYGWEGSFDLVFRGLSPPPLGMAPSALRLPDGSFRFSVTAEARPKLAVESFRVVEAKFKPGPYEGRQTTQVKGEWKSEQRDFRLALNNALTGRS